MERLKADLHTHTADDPCDSLAYSAETLIDAVASVGCSVLAITCHEFNAHSTYLAAYAARRDVLLVPGIERCIEGKHVLIINPDPRHLAAETFEELRTVGRLEAAFIAPHPYYPTGSSLRGRLEANIDLFDAVEWCSLYMKTVNPNLRAGRVAKAHGLPLVGTSDTHQMPYNDSTFSWIEAERTIESVVAAIRAGRVEVESRPRRTCHALHGAFDAVRGMVMETVRT